MSSQTSSLGDAFLRFRVLAHRDVWPSFAAFVMGLSFSSCRQAPDHSVRGSWPCWLSAAWLDGFELLEVAEESPNHLLTAGGEGVQSFVEGGFVAGVNVISSYDEVDGAAEGVGYLPSRRQWDTALGAFGLALVACVGGGGDVEDRREVLGGAVACLPTESLECSFAVGAVDDGGQ